MKVLKAVSFALVLSCLLASCNTVRGAGEDLSAGGHAVSRSVGGY